MDRERSPVPRVIIDTAKSKGADLILMASHGRSGAKAVLLGSVYSQDTQSHAAAGPGVPISMDYELADTNHASN